MATPTTQDRIDELVVFIKERLENTAGDSEATRKSMISAHISDFCRLKEHNSPGDKNCHEDVAEPLTADFDNGVFELSEVTESFLDSRIPTEWK